MFIEENIYADGSLNQNIGVKGVELSNLFGDVTDKAFDAANFTPRSSVYVTKNILVEAWDIDESANLLSSEQQFSQTAKIPEPSPVWILAAGLILIGLRKSVYFDLNVIININIQ